MGAFYNSILLKVSNSRKDVLPNVVTAVQVFIHDGKFCVLIPSFSKGLAYSAARYHSLCIHYYECVARAWDSDVYAITSKRFAGLIHPDEPIASVKTSERTSWNSFPSDASSSQGCR